MSEKGSFKSPPHGVQSEHYWNGLNDHRLVLQQCIECGSWAHPPTLRCRTCLSQDRRFVAVSGLGSVYTYTVTYKALNDEFTEDLPLIIAHVTLDEGPRIVSWLQNVALDEIEVGMRVKVVFQRVDERTTLHRFVPIREMA